jgi:hypothetical protein
MSSAWPPPDAIAKSDRTKWLLKQRKLEDDGKNVFFVTCVLRDPHSFKSATTSAASRARRRPTPSRRRQRSLTVAACCSREVAVLQGAECISQHKNGSEKK